MHNFHRDDPYLSLCGLNCKLCTMHIGNYCPGCGQGAGNQPCAIARCSIKHEGITYCFQCGAYPCKLYDDCTCYDSFITHQHQLQDMKKAMEYGIAAYHTEQQEKVMILKELLDHYNEGRSKNCYCVAVNLLTLSDLQTVMVKLHSIPETDSIKVKAATAKAMFQALADEQHISLKLRKKPKVEKV